MAVRECSERSGDPKAWLETGGAGTRSGDLAQHDPFGNPIDPTTHPQRSSRSLTRFSGHLSCGDDRLREESARCLLLTRRSSGVEPWISSRRATPSRETARDLGISESCLRNWMNRDAIDSGRKAGVTSDAQELVELRRRNRVLEMENEILKRASAYFARENVLPK
jgi:transposase